MRPFNCKTCGTRFSSLETEKSELETERDVLRARVAELEKHERESLVIRLSGGHDAAPAWPSWRGRCARWRSDFDPT